jgi:hypothetical protein
VEDDILWRDPIADFVDDRPAEVLSETTRYLNERCIPGSSTPEDVRDYWRRKAVDYLILAKIAADFLAIPATSAPSERVFSHGGDILTRKRIRICLDLLRPLVCLRS